jgi:hypothetical protein
MPDRANWIYKGVMLFFSVGLCFSVENLLRARQELKALTIANETLRKTLGNLIVALAKKDTEIDRLSGSPCNADKIRSAPVEQLTPAPKPKGI